VDMAPPVSSASGAGVGGGATGAAGAGAAGEEFPLSRVMSKASTSDPNQKSTPKKSLFSTIRHSLFGHKVKDSTAR
jgi:hypothetical protein